MAMFLIFCITALPGPLILGETQKQILADNTAIAVGMLNYLDTFLLKLIL